MQELWCSNTSDSRMRHRCHVTLNFLASGMRHTYNKYKGDLVASFSLISRYLKCFKYLLINPDSLYTIVPSKKNYDKYNKGLESYKLVSSSPKSELKLTRFEIPYNLSEAY